MSLMKSKLMPTLEAIIMDLSKNGGRFEFDFDGKAHRTMTFKPGFSPAKVDELIAMMADSAARELAQ